MSFPDDGTLGRRDVQCTRNRWTSQACCSACHSAELTEWNAGALRWQKRRRPRSRSHRFVLFRSDFLLFSCFFIIVIAQSCFQRTVVLLLLLLLALDVLVGVWIFLYSLWNLFYCFYKKVVHFLCPLKCSFELVIETYLLLLRSSTECSGRSNNTNEI